MNRDMNKIRKLNKTQQVQLL